MFGINSEKYCGFFTTLRITHYRTGEELFYQYACSKEELFIQDLETPKLSFPEEMLSSLILLVSWS